MYLLFRLQYARNVLCNDESRKKYDFWRRSGIAVPYEQWVELSGVVHTSLHWAAKPRKELMLDYRKGNTNTSCGDCAVKMKRPDRQIYLLEGGGGGGDFLARKINARVILLLALVINT